MIGIDPGTARFGFGIVDADRSYEAVDYGIIETVPAYSSTTIFFDPAPVREHFALSATAFEAIRDIAMLAIGELRAIDERQDIPVEISVIFDKAASIDLDEVSGFSGIARDEVISIFLDRTYRVFMIGFLPGFAYMGEVDDRIAIPRKKTPRTQVPAGSVGIAGKQTGIYPLESPGGWQIMGRTELKMFDPEKEPSCPLKPGDRVRFVPG